MNDTIYRQDAIDALADYIHNVDKVMGTGHLNADDCKDAATSVFEELPSAQPERKGKWIVNNVETEHCSVCKHPFYISALFAVGGNDEPPYCPNCGAKMEASES